MFDIFGVTALLLVAALGTWLALRARRARNRVVKWVGLVLASVVALAGTLAVVVACVGFYRINVPRRHQAASDIKVAGTPDQIARGARFSAFCAQCHSPHETPPLVGRDFMTDGPPVGTLWAPNLTSAGEIRDWSDGEVIRAIREGVHKSDRGLIIMPSEVFRYLSDADVEAIVAYLRAQPALPPNNPPTRLNVLAALFIGSGLASTSVQQPITHPIIAPAEGVSAEYGQYVVSILGCRVCHGEKLTGGKSAGPGAAAAPDLRSLLAKWSYEEFTRTLRTGVDPYNHTLSEAMPWKPISAFASDSDLRAMYAYLHGLTPTSTPTP